MKTNKLLSVVLTLCVLLAAFSLTALAADGETYSIAVAYCVEGDENGVVEEYAAENLQNAINEIAKTAAMFEATAVKMTLQADVTGVASTLTVPAGTEFTLDLAGHTLEGNNQGKDQAFLLVNGKLTLTDSVGTGKVCSDYTGRSGLVVSVVGGELTVAGGTITTEGMAQAGNAVNVGKGGVLKMTGGKVYADAKRGNYAIRIGGSDAVFEMTGGVAEADSSTTETYITAIGVSSTGTVTIGGDSVVRGPKALTTTSSTALTVTGGSFTGEVSAPKNSISGGTFTTDVTDYLADEHVKICKKQADGTYQVLTAAYAAAKIIAADGTATRYGSFADAVAALKDGDTLVMLADIGTAAEPLPYGIVVTDGDVNVNLNAKTLIIGYDAAAAAAAGVPGYAAGVGIVNGGSGTVTVSGNGTLDVSNYTGTDGIAVWARTGNITVQSGTFINKSNEEATVYVGTNDGNSPVLKIAGGTYKNIAESNYKYDESRTPLTFNIYNGKTADALKISAGSFYGNNDPYLGDDQVKGRILATEMTGVRKNDGYYVVAANQGIQLLDANGGAKNFYSGASTSSTGKITVALADAADGDTLILLKDISTSNQLNVTKAITIDLGGHTLTNSYAPSNGGYTLLTRAAVTMKNGTYKSTKDSARGIGAVADFTLENATLSAAGLVGLGCSAADATYTVKNSTVIGNYAIANFVNNAKINIEENSTITGTGVGIYHNGSNSGLQLTATGSTITAAATGATNGIYVSGSTDTMAAAGAQQVTLTNCTVSGGTAVEVKYTDLTLTDCTVTATAETPSYTQDDNGAATTGFAVVSTDNTTGAATPAPKGKITIQGANGSYKGQVGLASLETVKTNYADFADTTYAVSGGSFTKAVLPDYCAAGFVPTKNEDGTYGVTEKPAGVAKIGDKYYDTLADAIAAAKDGDTVTLTADINTPETSYYIQKSLTIDLGGKTLTGSGYDGVFNIEGENAAVRIKNGKIVAVEQTGTAGKYTMAVWACAAGCEVTLEDLDVSQQITHTDDKQMDMIYTSKGTIIINSGRFESDTPAWTLNCKDSAYKAGTAKIIVNGGTFVGYDPRNNTAEGKGTSFVAEGVGVDAADGSFTAVPNMAAQIVDADGNSVAAYTGHYDAIAAAKDGEKVILLSDRKNFVTNTINANITIDLNGKTLSVGNNNPFFRTNGEVTIQNGTITSNMACVIVNAYNKLTLKNVKITGVTGNNGKNLVNVCSNAEVTIDKDTVLTASGSNGAAVFIGQDADAKYTLNVYGKVIQESKSFAISGNGSYKGTTTINIYDGAEVKSASVAIYHPQAGVINVNGGLVEGYCAIGIKSGTLNINGGTVRGTADDHVLDDSNSTSGTIIYDGSAIIVDSRSTGYAGNVNINVTGGTVESYYSTAIREIGEQDKPNMTQLTKLNITGGSVLGANQQLGNVTNDMLVRDISSSNVSVSGGTFNHAVPETYCADGFIPTKNADGTYGVKKILYVAEVNGVKFATLADAIAAATRNSTVTLLADTKENVTISTPYVTLDLNGHTLNGSTGERKPALTITARVTVKDSSAAKTGTIMREDTAENSGVSSHYVIDVQGSGWLTFESGNVKNDSGAGGTNGASLVRVGDDRVAKYPGLNIKGGTFTQDNFIVIKVERGDLFLNGGSLNSANSYAVQTWHRATIKGGTVNGAVSSWTYDGGPGAETTISGGTVNGNVEAISYDGKAGKPALVSISGGTVNGALIAGIYNSATEPTKDMATIGITGGTFANDPTKYVVEGATVTKNSEGKFGVEKAYLARVGETEYYTMDEAFKAQTASGEPVVLLRDYTTGGTFKSGSINRTVDLNGYTWTYTGTDVNDAAFEINYPDVTLTVKNGTVVSSTMVGLIPSAMGGTIKYDNSGLVLDGVTATANGNSGIETNGNNTNDTVTLKNSTLNVPNGFGIYFPSSGTLTLDNSTVNAKTMGVQVCAGSLSINEGSAVTVTGDAVPKAENDGAIQDGAAISVVNRTGYKGLGTVTVSGGKFTAKEGNSAIKAYDWANKTESDFTADKGTVAVSGGTFSSEIKSEYCAEGFEPVANTDGTYTVGAKKAVEVWTGYTGTSVAAYATVAEAAANLGENKWIVITGDYTLTADFTIPADVRLDVADGAVLTVANGVTLTVAADAKRLAARTGAAIVNNGTILVCGTSYSNGYVMVQEGGTLDLGTLTVPEGCFLDNNGTNYFAAVATYSITYADGTTKQAGSLNNLSGAVRVTLLKNVTDFGRSFSSTDALADNFVFDLGGHTLSGKANASSQVMTIAAPMTVTNGTIVYASSNEHYGAIQTNDNVTFDASVTVDGGVGYALRTNGYGKTVVFNGTAVTNGEYAITGNGAESGGLVVDCSLVVGESANISAANGIAIYHPMLGTVSVTGGKISGHTGIEMCAGKLVVSGGEITSTGANHDETGSTDTIKDGAAISIINRNYPGGVPTLEVTGGIVKATGEGALAVKAYDYTADKVAEWTTAGEFVNISGGTFSSEIKSEYCAEGFEPVANTDGTYGVAEKARVGLSDNMMIIPRGLADGKYTMLILAAIDSLDYAEVGFKVMVYNDGKAVSDETMYSTTTVYTSVKDGAGKVWKPDDSELGDTKCKYLFASTMEIDASDKDAFTLDAYVRVVPYATDYDGNVLVKNTFNIPVTYFFN